VGNAEQGQVRQILRLSCSTDHDLLFDRGVAERGLLSQWGNRGSVEGSHKPPFLCVGRQRTPSYGHSGKTPILLPKAAGNPYDVRLVSRVVEIFAYHLFASVDDTIALPCPSMHPAGLKSILYQYDLSVHMEDFLLGHSDHVNGLIKGSESTVRSLSVCAEPLWRVPVRVFEDLSHLDIFLGQDMENLTLIFRYAARLESLSVLGLDNRAIFPLFEDHSDSLPSLRLFKIMSPYRGWQPDVDIEESQFLSLARFLRGKRELRALDIHLWPQGWSSFAPFWDLLNHLPSLEVLGITTGVRVFTKDDFLSFATALPPRLSALRVSTQWDIGGEEENDGCRLFVRTFCLSALCSV